MYPWQTRSVRSRRSYTARDVPWLSKSTSSTPCAVSLKIAKLVPCPSHVAPNGWSVPGQAGCRPMPLDGAAALGTDREIHCRDVLVPRDIGLIKGTWLLHVAPPGSFAPARRCLLPLRVF